MTALTQYAFARHLGVDRAHITRLKHAGRLVLTPDGQIDVEASEARIAATADPAKAPVAERHAAGRAAAVDGEKQPKTANQEMADKVTTTYQQSRAVRERYAALTAKAEYESLIGKLAHRLMLLPGVRGVRVKIAKLEIFDDCEVAIRMETGQW